jgi:ribosome-associated protein
LSTVSLSPVQKKNPLTKLTRNSKIFKAVIKAIQEKKGEKIISLDMRKVHEAVADFFVICEASNPTLLRAIAQNVEYIVKEAVDEMPYKHEGHAGQQWIIVDYVNIVVHVMLPEPRKFYNLEDMWHDAPATKHED